MLADRIYKVVTCNMGKSPADLDKKIIKRSLQIINPKETKSEIIGSCLNCKKHYDKNSSCSGPKINKGSYERKRYYCDEFVKKS